MDNTTRMFPRQQVGHDGSDYTQVSGFTNIYGGNLTFVVTLLIFENSKYKKVLIV